MSGVFLARHGRTAYNHERRFQGQLPVPLDDVGRRQARELADNAAHFGFRALWSSPLLRARETAEIVAERLALPIQQDPRLMETDAGDWTDRTFAEIHEEAPDELLGFIELAPDFAFPGGESLVQQTERVMQALAQVRGGQLPALVICHGVVIRLALRHQQPARPAPARIENGALLELPGLD